MSRKKLEVLDMEKEEDNLIIDGIVSCKNNHKFKIKNRILVLIDAD